MPVSVSTRTRLRRLPAPPTPGSLPEDRGQPLQEGEPLCLPVAEGFEREHREVCQAENCSDGQSDHNADSARIETLSVICSCSVLPEAMEGRVV